jgi:eukaryotic-like serine/threonine-protein kinase
MYCPTCKTHYPQGAFCAGDGTVLQPEAGGGLVGKVLADRYRILRLVGEGGMGQVFEAQHVNINKRFAIKLLRPEVVGSPQSLARFRQEAWAASSIGHDNIVEIDDFATLPSGEVYLAMEFLDGQSLAERLRDGPPLGLPEALQHLVAVASGLAAAHDKGIVHRDLKPENIFLAKRAGTLIAKILDFGIAKVQGGDEPSTLTRTGAIFGTPLYMSPEQARGRPADARADVYALGVILYEVATGRVPFGGESSVEILSQQIGAVPVAPSQVAPERALPPALEAIILRALAKEPEARQSTMAELVTELAGVAATLPPPPGPAGLGATGLLGAHPALLNPPLTQPPTGTNPPAYEARARTTMPARSRSARNVGAVVAALVAVLGLTWRLLPARHAATPAPVPLLPAAAPAAPASPPVAPFAPKEVAVIVDSIPTGARIERDGVVVGETPDAVRVRTPTPVLLRKDGFVDKSVVVDPAQHKLQVRLERAPRALAGKLSPPSLLKEPAATAAKGASKPAATIAAAGGAKVAAARPSRDKEVLEPYDTKAATSPAAAAKPPVIAAAAMKPAARAPGNRGDELSARVDRQAASSVPGGKRVGEVYRGSAPEEGGRSDWYVQLPAGHCYTFVSEGGDGVRGLYLYLWGPDGKRVTDARVGTPHVQMPYCTKVAGPYHFQAKISDGGGEYRVGIYQR